MTNNVTIKRENNSILVSSYYQDYFIKEAKKQNAKWNASEKAWVFEASREEHLKNILLEAYDYDMTNKMKTYDVLLDLDKYAVDENEKKKMYVRINGLLVADIKTCEFGDNFNVYLEEGEIKDKSWADGTKLLVKNITEYAFEKSLKDKAGVSVVDVKEAQNESEEDLLKKELADIQAKIKELKAREKELKAKLNK